MDLGLGTLAELKAQLLAENLRERADWDAIITAIGRGVADAFDKFCNRKLARLAGAVETLSADRDHWITNRYPIEIITTVEQRDDVAGGWVALVVNDIILNRDEAKGLLYFGALQGIGSSIIRLTYTGGYWLETLEPLDPTYPTAQPAGSTALPYDLKLAWFQQTAQLWDLRDRLGIGLVQKPEAVSALAKAQLLPSVRETLNAHVRYQIT